MTSEQFKTIQPTLPDSPGIYKFFDEHERFLYVGKAKNIKKRVTSYFNKNIYESAKTQLLVKKIRKIDFTIVETEQDALLLENLLVKKNQPRYNIQLRDDKTYPHLCIKKERFPRIFLTRTIEHDGSEYLGPYTSVKKVREILHFIRSLFQLRNCNLNLSQKNIGSKKFKVCLEYHIGNCKGPCEGLQTEESYNETIAQVRNILKGNISPVISSLKQEMKKFADAYEFEKAGMVKRKIDILENYQSKSTIVSPSISNVDVFSIIDFKENAFVNYLKVVNGSIIQTKTVEMKRKLDESLEDLLVFAITDLRNQFKSDSKELILPFVVELPDTTIKITVPERGEKKQLLLLSTSNATYYKNQRDNKIPMKQKKNAVLELVQRDFRLKEVPLHIECFDNSNFQGANPVAAMVVFKNGKPSNKDYRHYNIRTVQGPNDFASMEEIIYRRYKKLQEYNAPFPNLVIIDGGKGQLSSAVKALERLNLVGKIPIASIAKRLEEIYFPDDSLPLHISKSSGSLKLIQRIRNEAHRFAISFHRKKREKSSLKSGLMHIPGIGNKTSELLLKQLKSEKKIRQASFEELALIVGSDKAKKVSDFFSAEKSV